jgi:hypothetical protein
MELPELDSDLLRLGKQGVVGAIGERTPAAIESPGVELGVLEEAGGALHDQRAFDRSRSFAVTPPHHA